MHLYDLLERGNSSIVASEGVCPARRNLDGELLLGIELPSGGSSRVVLRGASEHPHLTGLEDAGFGATADTEAAESQIRVSFVAGGHSVSRVTSVPCGAYVRLLLPSPLDLPDPFARADIVIERDASPGAVFIGSTGITPRQALYRLAQGRGVEIGPGPRPQIHSNATTQVSYVEEMSAETWIATYRPGESAAAWDAPGYVIGKAHDLPVEDGSLDFIFSSHVLEHLYNPLGHFDHWRRKLRRGGLVLGVVPAVDGTKDFVQPSTSMHDLLQEHRSGSFDVPLSAHEAWLRAGQPNHKDPVGAARKQFEGRFSIHVHVYDYVSINALLRHCVRAHGYAGYRLLFKRNAKDFAFALKAGPSIESTGLAPDERTT